MYQKRILPYFIIPSTFSPQASSPLEHYRQTDGWTDNILPNRTSFVCLIKVRLGYFPSDQINIVCEVTSPKESDAHHTPPWVTQPYFRFYPQCKRHHHFARNPPGSEFLPIRERFSPSSSGVHDFECKTVFLLLLRLPCSQTVIARCKQYCRTCDRGSGSATILTLYFASCFHTVERASKASNPDSFFAFFCSFLVTRYHKYARVGVKLL